VSGCCGGPDCGLKSHSLPRVRSPSLATLGFVVERLWRTRTKSGHTVSVDCLNTPKALQNRAQGREAWRAHPGCWEKRHNPGFLGLPVTALIPVPLLTHLIHSFAADEVLTEEHLREVCDDLKVDFASGEDCFWGVVITLMNFLHQVASTAKSCLNAVAMASALRLALGLPDCSANTGAYCKARLKLPEELFCRLSRNTVA